MILDNKSYAKRIVEELRKEDPEKYKHITIPSVKKHLNHISWMFLKIIRTKSDELSLSQFRLSRGFKKFHHFESMRVGYNNKRINEMNTRVDYDNVIDRLCIRIMDYDFYQEWNKAKNKYTKILQPYIRRKKTRELKNKSSI